MDGNLGLPPQPPDRSTPGGVKGFGGEGGEVEQPLGGIGGRGGAASTMVEPMSTEWTDEKHSLYLNSIEASFLNKLYSSNYLLGWTLRTQKDQNFLGSHLETLYSGQFKVLREGCWGEVKFGKPWTRADIQNETCVFQEILGFSISDQLPMAECLNHHQLKIWKVITCVIKRHMLEDRGME